VREGSLTSFGLIKQRMHMDQFYYASIIQYVSTNSTKDLIGVSVRVLKRKRFGGIKVGTLSPGNVMKTDRLGRSSYYRHRQVG
jgi:hypothetical protein